MASAAGFTALSMLSSCVKDSGNEQASQKKTSENDFPLQEATIEDLQTKMQSGELTSRQIVELYLKRIEEIDKNGPELNSIIELNPHALDIADALDAQRKEGKVRGPMHGIPVLIKDNIDTFDKMMTTAGSLAMLGNYAKKDAFIITRLREAGAVLLGKTNLSEWANFRSTRSSSGWSSRGGQTKNPYLVDRSPCGSSSGSGTAVAANLCAIAIGTETDGSINCPASVNGIVGIKPTVGLWSRSGIIPISHSQDTAGPMARTVKDAATLLGLLAKDDADDPAVLERPGTIVSDYTTFLNAEGLKGKKIGIEKSFIEGHEAVDSLLQEAIDVMKSRGASIIYVDLMQEFKKVSNLEFDVLKYEFKDGLNKYLSNAKVQVRTLSDIIGLNKANEEVTMPYFKQEILEASDELGDLTTKEYVESVKKLQSGARNAIDNLFTQHELSAICGPANGPSWCIDLVNGDSFTGYGMYSPAAVAGYPSLTVPMGLVFDLPIGLTFLGTAYSEAALIEVAYAYEQATRKRTVPEFKGSSIV